MAASTEEGWEDGTAVAGAAYSEAIAKSEPDFENETGTAVAGQDYVEKIRKSGDLAEPAKAAVAASNAAAAAPLAVARPGLAQRAPTMAFGTPVMLRAPAATPERRTPAPLPGLRAPAAAPERRTPAPLPGLRAPGPVSAVPSVIPARESRSAQTRKPAPSGFVDQPFGEGERPAGAAPVAPEERRSRNMATASATPLAKERSGASMSPVAAPSADRSGGIAAPIAEERRSGAIEKPFVAEERDRRSGRISASMPQQEKRRDGRYSNPPPRANDVDAGFDDGAEDESAGDLEAFDHAETMGQPQRQSSPVIEQRAPAPLRPTPAPMRAVQAGYEPTPDPYARGASPDPTAHAGAIVPQQHPQYAPMPTDYRMVSADEMQAFRSPLSSPIVQAAAPAPRAAAPKGRVVLIAVSIAVVLALAVGGYLIFSGHDGPTKTAAVTTPAATKPTAAKAAAKAKPAATGDHATKPVATADKVTLDKAKPAVATAAQPPTSELQVPPKTTAKSTPPTTAKTASPTTAKATAKPAIAKTVAKPTATKAVKKVAKKPVRKAPVRRKAPVKRAAKCSGLDCV